MHIKNFEFKVRVPDTNTYETKLKELNPRFLGEDFQTDTYYDVANGRLKLREGKIENALISYRREDEANAKLSDVQLFKCHGADELKTILQRHLKIKAIVQKRRRIYFIDNVKFHFDELSRLGSFVEVEAIDDTGNYSEETLKDQCMNYFRFFGFSMEDMVDKSYSDLILNHP